MYARGLIIRKVIDILNEKEKEEILELFEKKQAMENLAKVINAETDEQLFQNLKNDYLVLMNEYTAWWSNNSEIKGWEKGNLFIDFSTNEVVMDE